MNFVEAKIEKQKQESILIYMAKKLIYTKRRQLKRRGASRRLNLELNLETLYVVRNARSARPCMREFLREAQNVHLIEPRTVLNIKWGAKKQG